MTPDPSDQVTERKKDEEVLEREGVEQKLMQEDVSEAGEEIGGVEEPCPGE